MKKLLVAACIFVVVTVLTEPALAGTVIMKNGKIHKGRVILTTDAEVWLKTFDGKTMRLKRSEIRKLEAGSSKQEVCYVIPLHGAIGKQFTAPMMTKHLEKAARLKASVIILEINSPGGSVVHAIAMIKAMAKVKAVKFVAVVRRAISAAAIITLACPDVYVHKDSVIGAAVAFVPDGKGGQKRFSKDVEEKMQSVWRAFCRTAAEQGGHSPHFADAMISTDFALTLKKDGAKVTVEKNGKGKVIKAKGKILTLTGTEATGCGLAAGVVEDYETLCKHKGWRVLTSATDLASARSGGMSPATLEKLLLDKMKDLGLLGGKLTSLQAGAARKKFEAWAQGQQFIGRRVSWAIKLSDAREDRNAARALTFARNGLERARERYAKARKEYRSSMTPKQLQDRKKTQDQCEARVTEAAKKLKEAEKASVANGIAMRGTTVGKPGFEVKAGVSTHCKGALLSAERGTELVVTGKINTINFRMSKYARSIVNSVRLRDSTVVVR